MNLFNKILKSKFLIPIVLFLLTFVLVFPFIGQNYTISFGEGPFALKPDYLNYVYFWQNRINLGNIFLSQTLYFLFTFIWPLFTVLSPLIQPTIVYVFIFGFFFTGLGFYIVLKRIFYYKNSLIFIPPVLLYTFNIFRVIAGNSDEMILLFFSLPLFFYFYYRLLHTLQAKYVFLLTILSILTSTMGKNLAIFSLPYILMGLYLIFYILFVKIKKDHLIKFILLHLALGLLLVLSNLFWAVPQIYLLNSYYLASDKGKSIWSVLGSGTFFDHFRFMGFWAFRDASYFPYTNLYYQPFLLFTTYAVSIISFTQVFFLKDKKNYLLKLFILLLVVLTYLLVSGNKGITGIFYQYIYDHISIMKMYRDSYAKFTPLFIFGLSCSLLISLNYIINYIKNQFMRTALIFLLSAMIVINSWPLFTITFEKRPSRPRSVSPMVKIPDYWIDIKSYFQSKKLIEWIFVFQNNAYGTNSNWPHGVNVVGNIAEFILDTRVIRGLYLDLSDGQQVIDNIYKNNYGIKNLKAYFGLLNSRYILQENDTEWRYSGLLLPPSQSNKIIQEKGFSKVAEFGKFTSEYLKQIPNFDPDETIKQELYKELTNKPGLILYKMEDKYFVPIFYTPKKVITSVKRIVDIDNIVSGPDYEIPSVVFLKRQNATPTASEYFNYLNKYGNTISDRPFIEYKEINPTKYRLVIHRAKTKFPLVFSANFSPNWYMYSINNSVSTSKCQIFPEKFDIGFTEDQATGKEILDFCNKGWISVINQKPSFVSHNFKNSIQNNNLDNGYFYETWFKKPLDLSNHLMANGYSNAWIIDPKEICSSRVCKVNKDGSYDMEIVLEYSSQKYLYAGYLITFLILTISSFFVITKTCIKYVKNL